MKVRARWQLRVVGAVVFAAAAFAPFAVDPGQRPTAVQVAVDADVERVARYLEWRAPVSLDPLLRRQVAVAVVEEARRAELDPLFVLAVMEVESDFVPDAVSNANARGLLQLRPITLREVERQEDLPEVDEAEPEVVRELRIGVRYLAMMERRFGSREQALAAWNAGPGAVRRALAEKGAIPERWLAFARNVEREHRRLRKRLGADAGTTLAQVAAP